LTRLRVGEMYYALPVVETVRAIAQKAEKYVANPGEWTKPILSSLLISGLPGQGKTELVLQFGAELRSICRRHRREFEFSLNSFGSDIVSEHDLTKCLIGSSVVSNAVRCFAFDEIDKARFDLFAHFLPLLEKSDKGPVVFWIFAQSGHPSYSAFTTYAETLPTKSLRDFLTRMQLGHIDLPSVRLSPEQRISTALGIAKKRNPTLQRVDRNLIFDVAQRTSIKNNRDILQMVATEFLVTDGCAYVAGQPERSLENSVCSKYPTSTSMRVRL
jgi:hypothetical protein